METPISVSLFFLSEILPLKVYFSCENEFEIPKKVITKIAANFFKNILLILF